MKSAVRRVFYGWWIVLSGFLIQMVTSGLGNQSGGLYIVVLQEEYGWTKTLISGVFALGTIQAAILAPFQGRLIDRFGPRAVVRTGIVIMGAGLIAVSTISSIATFVVYGLLLGLGFTLAFDVAPQTAVVNWFNRKRGIAMGLMMAGFGAGGALVPGVAWAMTRFSWRPTLLIGGIVVMVVGLAAAQLLRGAPEEYGLLPDGEPAANKKDNGTEGTDTPGFTVRQTLRTPSFWLLALYQAMVSFGISAIAMHLVPYAVESMDVSLTTAGSLMAVLTICIVIGHILGGFVGDRVGKRMFAFLLTLAQAGVLTLLIFGSSPVQVILFVVLQGLTVGAKAPLSFSIRAEYFGRKAYGTIWGISLAIVNIGNMAGLIITGFLADRFDGYREAFIVILALTCFSAVLLALAKRPRPI